MPTTIEKITLNAEQRLFTIPCGNDGYTCLSFDVCDRRIKAYAEDLGVTPPAYEIGTLAEYEIYMDLSEKLRLRFRSTGKRATAGLTPQLIGLEGKRVEVVTEYDETRRFFVGKSTGWIPCHLEIEHRKDDGGGAADHAYKSVRILSGGR